MIANAVILPAKADPARNATVSVEGDENGVVLSVHARGERWDLYMPTADASRLPFEVHRAVMEAVLAERLR